MHSMNVEWNSRELHRIIINLNNVPRSERIFLLTTTWDFFLKIFRKITLLTCKKVLKELQFVDSHHFLTFLFESVIKILKKHTLTLGLLSIVTYVKNSIEMDAWKQVCKIKIYKILNTFCQPARVRNSAKSQQALNLQRYNASKLKCNRAISWRLSTAPDAFTGPFILSPILFLFSRLKMINEPWNREDSLENFSFLSEISAEIEAISWKSDSKFNLHSCLLSSILPIHHTNPTSKRRIGLAATC